MAGRKKRLVMLLTRKELEPHAARFFEKVSLTTEKGCRLWRSGHADGDAPAFMLGHFDDGTLMNAKISRFAWAYHHGECPVDKIVIQSCGDARCVAIEHLRLEETWTVTRSAVAAQERPSLERYKKNFMEKVSQRADGCWFWLAARFGSYGAFWFNGRERCAHIVSYEMFNGPIEAGLVVRHKCHRKICVNPAHLILGTHAENMNDNVVAGLSMRGEVNGNSRLVAWQVLTIRLVNEFVPARGIKTALAKWYGVTQTTITHVTSGTTWWYEAEGAEDLRRRVEELVSRSRRTTFADLIQLVEDVVKPK